MIVNLLFTLSNVAKLGSVVMRERVQLLPSTSDNAGSTYCLVSPIETV